MKTARKSFQLCILLCKKYFNLKNICFIWYSNPGPLRYFVSFLSSTNSPMAAEIHYMLFIYVYIVNIRESQFT